MRLERRVERRLVCFSTDLLDPTSNSTKTIPGRAGPTVLRLCEKGRDSAGVHP